MQRFVLPPPRIRPWKRVAARDVSDHGVFKVQSLTMNDAAGKPRRDFSIFTCPDWCNVVAVTDDDHVVLVWQYRFGTDALSLEIPGGVIDAHETPIHAAARELREESGYAAREFSPLSIVEPNPALQNNKCHAFLATGAHLAGATDFDENEECEVTLVPVSALPALLDEGTITHSLCVVALETYLRKHSAARRT